VRCGALLSLLANPLLFDFLNQVVDVDRSSQIDFVTKTFRILDTAEVNFDITTVIEVIRPHIIFWKEKGRDPNESLPEARW
jgi:hypothetical protein